MTDFNITGTVLHVGSTQVISEKFQKRNLELETGEPAYPQINEIQFTQDRVSIYLMKLLRVMWSRSGSISRARNGFPMEGRESIQ